MLKLCCSNAFFPVNAAGAIHHALRMFRIRISVPPAKNGVSSWRMLTPAERIAGSSLEKESLPATSMEERRALTGEMMRMVEGIDSR